MPVAFALAGLSIWGFVRCVRQGQYDDLDTPAVRLLTDEAREPDSPRIAPIDPQR
jgi:cbb3-type cytochrome oxidase maturation protein